MVSSSRKNSLIGYFSNNNIFYAHNYENAYLVLYESGKYIDEIIHPMMFCLRHYLELMLKENIVNLARHSGVNGYLKKLDSQHKLDELLSAFKIHYEKAKPKIFNGFADEPELNELKKLVDLFSKIDNQSISFRYAKQKINKKTNEALLNFQQEEKINAEQIHSKYMVISCFLWALISAIEELEGK